MKSLTLILSFVALLNTIQYAQNFTLVNEEVGIDHVFRHNSFIGGGAVFIDYDQDGDDDLYLTSGLDMDQFYINNGDGTFTNNNITAGFVITAAYYTTGATSGDINNDGYPDIFVCVRGSTYELFSKNFLFLNNCDGTFTDIWDHQQELDLNYSVSATMLDYDMDGLLDIYVTSYVEEAGFLFDEDGAIIGYDHTCFGNQFYRNLGGNKFERKSDDFGIQDKGCSLAALATDLDSDADLDVLLANDFGEFILPNSAYFNQFPQDSFTNEADNIGANQGIYGMGIAAADFDLDNDLDYYCTNFGQNILLRNTGGQFQDVAKQTNSSNTWWIQDSLSAVGWGCVFADLNNDSYPDLYVANGYVPSPSFINTTVVQNDHLLRNDAGIFVDITESSGINNTDVSRGVAYSDYDNDGDLDLFVVVQNVPINGNSWSSKLYRNDTDNSNNYLQVDIKAANLNRDAIGSKVRLHCGDKIFLQEKYAGSSHCSKNSDVLHFGLGDCEMVDSIVVDWLGIDENKVLFNVSVNQRILILEDSLSLDTIKIDTMTIDTMAIDTMTVDTMIVDTTSFILDIDDLAAAYLLYPNPTSGYVHLKSTESLLTEVDISVLSNNGALWEKRDKFVLGFDKIDMSEAPAGLYYFVIKSDGNDSLIPFVKY